MIPPEVKTSALVERICDACQDLHKTVVVFHPVGDEVRICEGCAAKALRLLGYVAVPLLPVSDEDDRIVAALMARRRAAASEAL